MDDDQLGNQQLVYNGVGFGDEKPDLSALPFWNWQLDNVLEEEVLDAASLMQSYRSEPLFPTQNLVQDESFSTFEGENGFWDDMKDETENKNVALGCHGEEKNEKKIRKVRESKKVKVLTFKEVSRYFYMPIMKAAKELNIGVTLLKKKCRELGIPRWPHRKLKSLQNLIKNIKEYETAEEVGGAKLVGSAIEILEQETKLMEIEPTMQLEGKTKRLRQACFKANYKKRRLMAPEESQSSATPSYPCIEDSECIH